MIIGEVEDLAALAARPLRPAASADGGGGGTGMAAIEQAVRAAMLRVGAVVLEELLGADAGYRGPRIDCGGGHTARFIGYRDKSIDTVVGRIRLRRAYYHCACCGSGVVPRDAEAGVAGRSCSPGLAGACARAGAAMPFAAAAALVGDLAGIEVGAKRLERAAEASGAVVAAAVDAEAAAITAGRLAVLPPPGRPDMLYIAVDGTGVPMRPAETAGRAGKYPDGRARTREVKLACVFTQTGCDRDGSPVRDADSTSYVATFAPADQFGALARAEAARRGSEHVRQLVVLGDGAPWIWNQATARWPEATQIVDLYHAREHLYEIAGLLADTLGDDLEAWTGERIAELDAGHIDALVAAARRPLAREGKCHIVDKALPYFQRNAHRMQYARFRRLGMFVGSGTEPSRV
ncbi:ISKra4 family transposase [Tomitella gaofuii]|uniref:ISKra4 family transposase n=1 Tax=Tomitella gaofuii TaxID=2760083 RepID=UPI0015FAB5C8|nr:ISKra4 family transposase [Tomitella gaofuii]